MRTYELLNLPLDPGEMEPKDIARVGGVILGAARMTLGTQVRVDEQRLKAKSLDLLPKILQRVEEERKRLLIEG